MIPILHFDKSYVASLICFVVAEKQLLGACVSVTSMEAAVQPAMHYAAPELPYQLLKSIPLQTEATSQTGTDTRHHTNSRVGNASTADIAYDKDPVAQIQVDSQSIETSTPPARSTDGVDAKIDVNGHREVPIAPTKDCSPAQTTKDHHEPGWIVENTNGKNTVPQNTPKSNGTTVDAVDGDDNRIFTLAPLPLTNGHHKDTSTSINTSLFDDVWSPATKLKRRLEDTTDLIVCPGVYDGFSARIALAVGFDAMYMV